MQLRIRLFRKKVTFIAFSLLLIDAFKQQFKNFSIFQSESGVQQRDNLNAFLFSLTLWTSILKFNEFTPQFDQRTWY